MTESRNLPDRKYLKECFSYDRETGMLLWRTRPLSHFDTERGWNSFNTQLAGKPAGTISVYGYRVINMKKRIYRANRIIWKIMTGRDPGMKDVDHRNLDKLDNSWDNLRLATDRGSSCNRIYGEFANNGS
jgi:hypothetical protein